MPWNPAHYLTRADERGRPFVELMARVRLDSPARVVDLGCGPGNLTDTLAVRWPDADVLGLDSSAEMIEAARRRGSDLRYEVQDLRAWLATAAPGAVDVLVSNATLQWVPDHLALLPELLATVAPGGAMAVQVPGNHRAPSHALLAELATDPRFAPVLAGVERPHAHEPADYLRALQAAEPGLVLDVWETTYQHVLTGEDAVFEWVSATGARPTLEALATHDAAHDSAHDTILADQFEAEYRSLLREAYPAGPDGSVVLPFRRIFVVAHRNGGLG